MRGSSLILSCILVSALAGLVACASDDEGSGNSASTGGAAGSVATGGTGGAAGAAAGGTAGSLACDPATYAAEALASGEKLFNGVSLTESTPMGEVTAAPASFEGKLIRIEGFIVEICQDQGCYVILRDLEGHELNLKVTDGAIDFRQHAELGQYAIGEGLAQQAGEHGAQIYIQDHGAVIGTTVCSSFTGG